MLFTNGTNPSWSSGLSWDGTNGRLKINDMIQVGNTAPGVYSGVKPGLAVYDQNNVSVEGYLSVFHSAVNGSTGVVHRYLNQRGTDPASPSPYLAGDYAYREQISSYGTGGGFLAGHSIREIQYITDSTTGNVPTTLQSIRSGSANIHTSINLLPSGATIGNINSVTYTSTALARFAVIGSGTTSSTYTASFQNSTGTNNALVIRDDGSIGVGTSTPSFQFHMVGSAPNMTIQRYSDSTTPPVFRGWKSRGTTSVPSAVLSGDGLASFIAGGYDGSGSFDTASIQMIAEENFTGSSNRGTYISFNTNAVGAAAASGGYERMRISSAGNIGIGTTSPATTLDISGGVQIKKVDTNTSLSMYGLNSGSFGFQQAFYKSRQTSGVDAIVQNGDRTMEIRTYGYDGSVYQTSTKIMAEVDGVATLNSVPGRLTFYTTKLGETTYAERMRVDNAGNVGVGTTNIFDRLSVSGLNQTLDAGRGQIGVYSNDEMAIDKGGQIVLGGSDTTGGIPVRSFASIAGRKLNSTSGDRSGYLQLSVRSDSSGDLTEYMRIVSGGNVGIGTVTPSSQFHVKSASGVDSSIIIDTTTADIAGSDASISIREAGVEKWKIRNVGDDDDSLKIGTSSNNWVKLKKDTGNFGIGNSINPAYKLQVGDGSVVGIVSRFQNSTGTCDINPTTTSLSCSSDRTLKTNITNLNNTILNQITTLQPVTYTWINDNTNQQQTGFIAQDVEAIFPSLVSTDPTTNLKSLNYIGLIPYAIEGIRELDIKLNQQASLDTTLQGSFGYLAKEFLANVNSYIKDLTVGKLKVDGDVCVDDVCISKEQFKQMLIDQQNRSGQVNNVVQENNPEIIPDNQNNEEEPLPDNQEISIPPIE